MLFCDWMFLGLMFTGLFGLAAFGIAMYGIVHCTMHSVHTVFNIVALCNTVLHSFARNFQRD